MAGHGQGRGGDVVADSGSDHAAPVGLSEDSNGVQDGSVGADGPELASVADLKCLFYDILVEKSKLEGQVQSLASKLNELSRGIAKAEANERQV